jgi:hypothetical protein
VKEGVLVQRFEIEQRAGVGGMGVVYRARDRESGAPVAVKVLSAAAAPGDTERASSTPSSCVTWATGSRPTGRRTS